MVMLQDGGMLRRQQLVRGSYVSEVTVWSVVPSLSLLPGCAKVMNIFRHIPPHQDVLSYHKHKSTLAE